MSRWTSTCKSHLLVPKVGNGIFYSILWKIWEVAPTVHYQSSNVSYFSSSPSFCPLALLYYSIQHKINIKWLTLPPNVFKLNTNGLHISHSAYVCNLSSNLGRSTSVISELWGLVYEMQLTSNKTYFIDKMTNLNHNREFGLMKSTNLPFC